jgi:hypothetical protein
VAKKDTDKKDDLELNEKDAEAVKGGAHRKSHAASHINVKRAVHGNPSVNKGPQKT